MDHSENGIIMMEKCLPAGEAGKNGIVERWKEISNFEYQMMNNKVKYE
jgi:hypothetical protein